MTVSNLTCDSGGQLYIFCYNSAGEDKKMENVTVSDAPRLDPKFPNRTLYPRIGENATIEIHTLGCPTPIFFWIHNKIPVNHTDGNHTSRVDVNVRGYADFGLYNVVMGNQAGQDTSNVLLKAKGPPETPVDFRVKEVEVSNVTLSWVSGYNYNTTQTFIVKFRDGEVAARVPDLTDGRGDIVITHTIMDLNELSLYSMVVQSNNTDGISPASNEINFTTLGSPKQDPNATVNFTSKPRVKENVDLVMHTIANPFPDFLWQHNNTRLNSSDHGLTSILHINDVAVNDFGYYNLTVSNKLGRIYLQFELIADGPPEAPSQFTALNVGETNATLSWISGYDYNSMQTFVIQRYIGGKATVFKSFIDVSGGGGDAIVIHTIMDLTQTTTYNFTLLSKNSRGETKSTTGHTTFSTLGAPSANPDRPVNFIFKPRLQQTVTLTMHAVGNPVPSFMWEHDGVLVNSSDSNYTSQVTIQDVNINNYGIYTLAMENEFGKKQYNYSIEADGPPEMPSALTFTTETNSTVNLTWVSGFDYNNAQTFHVLMIGKGKSKDIAQVKGISNDTGGAKLSFRLTNLVPDTLYNIAVTSQNARGKSNKSKVLTFVTYGKPQTDPNYHVVNVSSPRLSQTGSFVMKVIANPKPMFLWIHNGFNVTHADTNLTSAVSITNVTADDYGDYNLDVRNSYGESNFTFILKATGPPAGIKLLNVSQVTDSSVVVFYIPGFNYGTNQTFTVQTHAADGNWTDFVTDLKDKTNGKGQTVQSNTINNLSPSTLYIIRMIATNFDGPSEESMTIQFTTSESKPGKHSKNTAAIAGGISGGVAVFLLIIVIVLFIKNKRANRTIEETPSFEEPEEQMDQHTYRYDDAALLN
ncbi:hemicentin-1-like [Mya arenaria]|uniref:hemicentin-1-like n=1 Tax=Mya arenaria TaxID=6604 RepID=UPI0022E4072B|nr:hemicentin-1-like [Mya arenaria]